MFRLNGFWTWTNDASVVIAAVVRHRHPHPRTMIGRR